MSTKTENFKYDVAFSFLDQDEPLVMQLNSLLQERLSTFIYTDRQKEIAGTDGEKTFNEVFINQSRIVVVFYREKWGSTSWTRIEETAIKNRAYEKGYNFALFIPMEDSPKVPEWLPKTRLWIGFKRWGIEGAASIIEARVQEAGGTIKVETSIEHAERIARDLERRKARKNFLCSENGVKAAIQEVDNLFLELQKSCDEINTKIGWTFDKFLPTSKDHLFIYSSGITLGHVWGVRWSNTLDEAHLNIRTWRGKCGFPNTFHFPGKEPVMLEEFLFSFDTYDTKQFGWRNDNTSERILSSKELAEYSIKLFVDAIHKLKAEKLNR